MVLQQPINAVVRSTAFLIGCERDDDVTVGFEALSFVPNQVGNPDRGLCFVVGRASAVEVAVLLHEYEGIHAPAFALGFDHIDVSQQQNGLLRSGAVIPDNKVCLLWDRAAEKDI